MHLKLDFVSSSEYNVDSVDRKWKFKCAKLLSNYELIDCKDHFIGDQDSNIHFETRWDSWMSGGQGGRGTSMQYMLLLLLLL